MLRFLCSKSHKFTENDEKFACEMIQLTLHFKKNVKLKTFLCSKIKKSILSKIISNISDFHLNMEQLQKVPKSAKGLISFFC